MTCPLIASLTLPPLLRQNESHSVVCICVLWHVTPCDAGFHLQLQCALPCLDYFRVRDSQLNKWTAPQWQMAEHSWTLWLQRPGAMNCVTPRAYRSWSQENWSGYSQLFLEGLGVRLRYCLKRSSGGSEILPTFLSELQSELSMYGIPPSW